MPGRAFTQEKLPRFRTRSVDFTWIICQVAAKSAMWLASRFAAVWRIFSNIFRKKWQQNKPVWKVLLANGGRVDKLWFKHPLFVLLHCDNSAPCGQAWKTLLSHQSYASASFHPDYWSNYFPGLATSAEGQNLRRISAFTPEMFQSFGSYAGVTFWCERGFSKWTGGKWGKSLPTQPSQGSSPNETTNISKFHCCTTPGVIRISWPGPPFLVLSMYFTDPTYECLWSLCDPGQDPHS